MDSTTVCDHVEDVMLSSDVLSLTISISPVVAEGIVSSIGFFFSGEMCLPSLSPGEMYCRRNGQERYDFLASKIYFIYHILFQLLFTGVLQALRLIFCKHPSV
ncbi:hypothetical protein ANCCAN_13391, partial [Ancylostoma caninum]